jgi:1-acyl-sn-glycerol-3-phosphate acyltransferase
MMLTLRSALYQLILFIVVIPYCLLVIASSVLPRMVRHRIIIGWPRFAAWLAIWLLGIRYEVRGAENIPAEPVVILSKHQSAWETLAFSEIFPPHVYVLKRELLWLPFLGWGLALMGSIAINRANRKAAMMHLIELGATRFSQGLSIMIFPEGTRIPAGQRGTYRRGGAVLAVNTGTRVLPVAHNAGLLWPRNSFIKYPGTVTVCIGPPIETAGRTPEHVIRATEEWIETQMQTLTPSTLKKTQRAPSASARQQHD